MDVKAFAAINDADPANGNADCKRGADKPDGIGLLGHRELRLVDQQTRETSPRYGPDACYQRNCEPVIKSQFHA